MRKGSLGNLKRTGYSKERIKKKKRITYLTRYWECLAEKITKSGFLKKSKLSRIVKALKGLACQKNGWQNLIPI